MDKQEKVDEVNKVDNTGNLWREYVSELRKHLPEQVFQPVPHRLLWNLPFVALIVGSMLGIALLDLHVLVKLILAAVIGLSFASLGFLAHEIVHGSVVRNRLLRDLTGAICFLPFNLGPKLWHKWHNLDHHSHTQRQGEDPDAMATLADFRARPALPVLYRLSSHLRSFLTFFSFFFWFSYHGFQMLRRYLPEFRPAERAVALGQFIGPVVFWLTLLVLVGPLNFLFIYVIPVLIANFVVMSYIATNHLLNPMSNVNDPLATSLSVRVSRWVDVIHFNFSHHTEHHVFPTMNPKYAPLVKTLLQRFWRERYHEMPHWQALATLWRTPRLYRDHTSLIDPNRGAVYPTLGYGLDPNRVRPAERSAGVRPEPEPPTVWR